MGTSVADITAETPLLVSSQKILAIKAYKRRWWILFLYALLSAVQNCFWLTYNTIGNHVNTVLNIDEKVANVISMLAPMWYVVLAMPIAWMVDNYGIRKSMLGAASLLLFCGLFRCAMLGPQPLPLTVVFIAQSANAIAGPLLNSVPALISTTWFPPEERALATAIGFLSQNLGSALAFVLGLIVTTDQAIWLLLYIEAGMAFVCTVPVFIYFPERPPSPPSASSAELTTGTKLSMWRSIKAYFWSIISIMKNIPFVLVLLAGGVSTGVSGGWLGLLNNILGPLNYSVPQVSGIGVGTTLCGILGGIVMGIICDKVPRRLKLMMLILFALGAAIFIWFLAVIFQWIPSHPYWMALVSSSVACIAISGTGPLLFEANLEITYPAPQALSGAILTAIMNLCAGIFMATKEFVDSKVINWIFFGSLIFAAAIISITPIQYKRSDVDSGKAIESMHGSIQRGPAMTIQVNGSLLDKDTPKPSDNHV
jgi:MFS family permease